MLGASKYILGAFQEDLGLFGQLRDHHPGGIGIEVRADHAPGEPRLPGILQVVQQGLKVLGEFFAYRFNPPTVPAHIRAGPAQGLQRAIFALPDRLGVQELIQNRGRIVGVAAVALDQGSKGMPGALTFQALGSAATILEFRIVPPTVENPLRPHPAAMLTRWSAAFLGAATGGDAETPR